MGSSGRDMVDGILANMHCSGVGFCYIDGADLEKAIPDHNHIHIASLPRSDAFGTSYSGLAVPCNRRP